MLVDEEKNQFRWMSLLNFLLQLFLIFYPTDEGSTFKHLIGNTEFIVVALGFRAYSVTDEMELFCRLLGVFFAVISKTHSDQGSMSMIFSTSISTIVLILCIILNLSIELLDSRSIGCDIPVN